MPSRRRNKAVLQDDLDDWDASEGEYDMTPEEKETLQQGVKDVQARLDPSLSPSRQEIEDTLWYYEFALEETVSYLQKKHTPRIPKQQAKNASRFDEAQQAAHSRSVNGATTGLGDSHSAPGPRTTKANFDFNDFFKDTPWLRVPPGRLTTMTPQHSFPRGRLLGGASNAGGGKPSKLAALAASRRKAQEEKRQQEKHQSSQGDAASSSVALLDKLSFGPKEADGGAKLPDAPHHPNATLEAKPRTYKRQRIEGRQQEPAPVSSTAPEEPLPEKVQQLEPQEDLRNAPSAFAATLFGPEMPSSSKSKNAMSLSYPHNRKQTNHNPFSSPSPDDLVNSAQAKGAKGNKPKQNAKDSDGLAKGVSAVKLDDEKTTTKVKFKNIDVAAEFRNSSMKRSASFVVIGHVDHGKSTLMGRLLQDTAPTTSSTRAFSKLRQSAAESNRSSFAYAWLLDSTSEERSRGITIEVATNSFETADTRFTILDAPGHRDYVPNMIAGAAQADFAVLVVDAATNAFEAGFGDASDGRGRGQTREHALLIRSLGIPRVVVAVNKMDVAGWSQDRFAEIKTQMSAFLTSAGFRPDNLAFVPCAGLTGENVVRTPAEIHPDSEETPWSWNGSPTLLAALDALPRASASRKIDSPLRLSLSNVFKPASQAAPTASSAISVTGRVEAGTLQPGQVLRAQPSGDTAVVKSIELDGASADWAVAGMIATVGLVDVDPARLVPGDMLSPRGEGEARCATAFSARVLAFEPLIQGRVELYRGRMGVTASVEGVMGLEGKRMKKVKAGAVGRVSMRVEGAGGRGVPVEAGDRVVLREAGVTVAAGVVG